MKRTSARALRRKSFESNPDVFRACSVSTVLHNCAGVFHSGLGEFVGAAAVRNSVAIAQADEQDMEHIESDKGFSESVTVEEVDFFISHVWIAGRWLKWLALTYYINISVAVAVAVATWLSTAVILVYLKGYAAYGGQSDMLVPLLVWLPVGIFFVTFFFGHVMFPRLGSRRAWLDKLCIHQTRLELKVLGVSALLDFVANSDRMLILWSDTYFERLWCNAEVATFVAINGVCQVDFMPLWFAPWVLVTILVDLLCMWIFDSKLSFIIPLTGDFVAKHFEFVAPNWVSFLTQTFGIGLALGPSYLPAVLINYISFTNKMKFHDLMMHQVREYRLQDAKCAVETDRAIVEKSIVELFSEMNHLGVKSESPDADPIERFNHFINNDFANAISVQVGSVSKMPWGMCLLVFMPLNFEALANVFGCDGMPCEQSWIAEGFSSKPEYIATNALMWLHGVFLIFPTTYPVMFTGLSSLTYRLEGYPVLLACASMMTIAASYLYMSFLMGAVCGVVSTSVISKDPIWFAGWVGCLVALTSWNYVLFV